MKKICSLFLSCVLVCSAVVCLSGCGTKYPADAIVVYTEYNGLTGRDDDKVKAAIEQKFKADTGESLTLYVEPHATNTLGNKVTGAISAGERIDAVVTHYSDDSFLSSMITGESELKDLTDLVPQYAPDYLARFTDTTDPSGKALRQGMFNGKTYALSSIEHNSIFGMLINKTHMAKTEFDPDEYDVANPDHKTMTISQFTKLLQQLKTNVGDGLNRPLCGAPYDIEYFLLPAFESKGYNHMELIDGRLYPAWVDDNYRAVLEYERSLQEQKLWTDNPLGSATANRDFLAGKASVYTLYPEVTQQIETAKKLKKSTGDDCIMLAPLRGDTQETSLGNARHISAFLGLAALRGGKNTELLLKYVNWLSLKENYELAKYGIEGEHWVKTTLENGKEAYAYPEGKQQAFEESAPYSGVYCLLSDVHLSNRTYAGYTRQQAAWVEKVHGFPCYPADGYDDEGINLPEIPAQNRTLRIIKKNLDSDWTSGLRALAWSDAPLGDHTIASMHGELAAKMKDGEYKAYVDFLTTEYNRIIASFR